MKQRYPGEYAYEIKTGEAGGAGVQISNEAAGLYLRAFDLKEPWATHRKYEVFEDKHADLFGRPEVKADRIVLLHVIVEAAQEAIPTLENQLFAKYALTRYLILYLVRQILEADEILDDISRDPARFIRKPRDRAIFKECIGVVVKDIVRDLNAELKASVEHAKASKTQAPDFDYRGKLRDSEWVRTIERTVVAFHRMAVSRGIITSFKDEWEKRIKA